MGKVAKKNNEKEMEFKNYFSDGRTCDDTNNTIDTQSFQTVTDRLRDLQENIYRGAQIRSRLPHVTPDEAPTRGFLNLETCIQGGREIREIYTDKGDLTTDPGEITNTFYLFYKNLFKREETDTNVQDEYLNYCKSIANVDRDTISVGFSVREIEMHLKT